MNNKILYPLAFMGFLLGILLLLLMFAGPPEQSPLMKNEPTGFNGILWDTSIDNNKEEMIPVAYDSKEDSVHYKRKNSTLIFGPVVANRIIYSYTNNHFDGVIIHIEKENDFNAAIAYLKSTYGQSSSAFSDTMKYPWAWKGSKTEILAFFRTKDQTNTKPGGCILFFTQSGSKAETTESKSSPKVAIMIGVSPQASPAGIKHELFEEKIAEKFYNPDLYFIDYGTFAIAHKKYTDKSPGRRDFFSEQDFQQVCKSLGADYGIVVRIRTYSITEIEGKLEKRSKYLEAEFYVMDIATGKYLAKYSRIKDKIIDSDQMNAAIQNAAEELLHQIDIAPAIPIISK